MMSPDERIAMLLDGRLHGADRDAMLLHLLECDEDRAVLVGAAAILLALEEEDRVMGDR
jgi:hypothetical protein